VGWKKQGRTLLEPFLRDNTSNAMSLSVQCTVRCCGPLGGPGVAFDNINMDCKEIDWDIVNWIHLA
jgi:hypothetical protein